MAIRTRVGQGFDIHRFVDGPSDRVLVLGGVKFPNEKPLAGHSDADVIAHAAADALLGAASLGDIGMHFPDTDPQWAGANSLTLLAHVATIVREAGFEIGNVDHALGGSASSVDHKDQWYFSGIVVSRRQIDNKASGIPVDGQIDCFLLTGLVWDRTRITFITGKKDQ